MAARKKARKSAKKAGKKAPSKAASKKKRKKKAKKKASPAPKARDFVVKLRSNNQGVDNEPKTSRRRRDLVKWVNDSSHERRLAFSGGVWPFEGSPCDIVVPLNGETGWYRVEKRPGQTGLISYSYSSTPPFAPGGPPGDPVVDAGD